MNLEHIAQELHISTTTVTRMMENMGWENKIGQDSFSEEEIAELKNADQIRQRLGQKGVRATYKGEDSQLRVRGAASHRHGAQAQMKDKKEKARAAKRKARSEDSGRYIDMNGVESASIDDMEDSEYFQSIYEEERRLRAKVMDHAFRVLATDGSAIHDMNALRAKYMKLTREQIHTEVSGLLPPPLEFEEDRQGMPKSMLDDEMTIEVDAEEEEDAQ